MDLAVRHLRAEAPASPRIGVEAAFLPMDSAGARRAPTRTPGSPTPSACWSGCVRSRRRPSSDLLRGATERIGAAMQATIAGSGEGATKRQIIERLRFEETGRGTAVRLLPADARASPQPRRLGPGLGAGRGDVDRLGREPSAATSATSAGWACWASPTPSSTTFSARSRRCSRRPSPPSAPGGPGGDVIAAGEAELARQPNRGLHRLRRPRHGPGQP